MLNKEFMCFLFCVGLLLVVFMLMFYVVEFVMSGDLMDLLC